MARSHTVSALALALGAGIATYLFATPHGRRTRSASSEWLRERTPDVSPQLARIERQIDALGTDLRRRLDALQAEMQPRLDVSFDAQAGDVRHDLRDMPG